MEREKWFLLDNGGFLRQMLLMEIVLESSELSTDFFSSKLAVSHKNILYSKYYKYIST